MGSPPARGGEHEAMLRTLHVAVRNDEGRITAATVYGAVLVWLRFAVVAFWIAAAVFATMRLPTIGQAQAGALGALVPHGAPALKAEAESLKLFGIPVLSRVVDVQHDPHGLSPAARRRVYQRVLALDHHAYPDLRQIVGAYAIINDPRLVSFARGADTTALTFLFFRPSAGTGTRVHLADRLGREYMSRPGGGFVGATGTFPARLEYENTIGGSLGTVTLATLALVIVLVALRFRALGAPLVTVFAVAISYLVSVRVVAYIAAHVGITVPQEVKPVIVVLLFGVVTDYSVFFLSRFRDRLALGEERRIAAARATGELLPIIATAGLTVVLASAALIVSPLDFFRAFGPGVALAVFVSVLVCVSLIPATLAIFGSVLYWPRRPRAAAGDTVTDDPGRRPISVRLAARHPVPVVLACLVLLGLAISGLSRLSLGGTLVRGLPSGSEPVRAYDAAAAGFAPGALAPTVLIVEHPGVTRQRAALARLQRGLAREPGVAGVIGPASNPLHGQFGVVLSSNGGAARYIIVLDAAADGARAIGYLDALKAHLPGLARSAGVGGARLLIAGDTALTGETVHATVSSLERIVPLALAAILVVLLVFLLALLAPLYLVAAAALAPAAAIGVSAYFFQTWLGYGAITYYVPVAAMVLLIALGSDYNVYLIGRVWEEAHRRPVRDAVLIGAGGATQAIFTAGLALAGSFALLALVPLLAFGQIAFTMAAGLLIDAFLVRALLIPALTVLLGRRSGWPGHQLRRDPSESAPHPRAAHRARVARNVTGRWRQQPERLSSATEHLGAQVGAGPGTAARQASHPRERT